MMDDDDVDDDDPDDDDNEESVKNLGTRTIYSAFMHSCRLIHFPDSHSVLIFVPCHTDQVNVLQHSPVDRERERQAKLHFT